VFFSPASRSKLPSICGAIPPLPSIMTFSAIRMIASFLSVLNWEECDRLRLLALRADFSENCFRHDRLLISRLCLDPSRCLYI
jgi:hypothetical protein